jgi:hypothetical protein
VDFNIVGKLLMGVVGVQEGLRTCLSGADFLVDEQLIRLDSRHYGDVSSIIIP